MHAIPPQDFLLLGHIIEVKAQFYYTLQMLGCVAFIADEKS